MDEERPPNRRAVSDSESALDLMGVGFVSLNESWLITEVNRAAEKILGYTAAELVGQELWTRFPGARELQFGRSYESVMRTREPLSFDAFYPGLGVWFELRVRPITGGIACYFLDITARKVAIDQAQAANRRLALLSRVSEVLSDTSDPDAAVGQLAQLVIPELGDWCLVTVVEDDGNLRDVGFAHRDPALEPTLAEYSARRSVSMSDSAPRSEVLRRGEPLIVEHFSPAQLAAAQPDPDVFELVHSLDPDGLATVPLISGGRVLGVLTLVTTSARGPHTSDEVASALEIGRRAGPVLEAARVARRAQSLAESVQRSVLALPPPPPGLQIATRYRPATVGHEVGGDWYDTFTLGDGSTVVTIGDVMGHDVAAIAAMAQLRTFMQACAWTVQHSPAEVLTATDRAGFGLRRRTFATVLTADLAPAGADGAVAMRWSSAGHLPAVLIAADGSPSLLRASRTDPPLGVTATAARHDHSCVLAPGSVLLLFTDGLIERRDRELDVGLAALLALVGDVGAQDLDRLLDLALEEIAGDTGCDDVALIAVRIGGTGPTDG